MNIPFRREYRKGGFGPAKLRDAIDIPIAQDNIVCGVCGASLGDVNWCIVSSPIRKGVIVFACEVHVGEAMNLLGKILGGSGDNPPDLKLPNEKDN